MFTSLSRIPANPSHFIALCFLKAKDDPSYRSNNKLLKKVAEKGNVAIFQCAYGYFCVGKSPKKNQKVSKNFTNDLPFLRKMIGL